jgi:trk system potassium uptake protein TrkH
MRIKLSIDKVQMFSYFIFLCFTGSVLLSFPFAYTSGVPVPYVDALFTSVSAVCVTGLSTVPMDIYSTAGFIVIMILIELGGLGIITFVAFYIAMPKRKVSLANRSVIRDFFIDDVESEPHKILRSILIFTFSIEFFCAILLFFAFKSGGSERPVLDAVFHAVSAFCNAGFSTYNTNLEGFHSNNMLLSTVMFLIVSGGIGFIVLSDIVNTILLRKKKMSFHSRMVLIVTFLLISLAAAVFFILDYNGALKNLPLSEKIFASLFQAITPRTAGFDVITQTVYSPLSQLITAVLMFIGGSPGGTAGGIKTTTFLIIVLYAIRGNTERNGLNIRHRNVDVSTIEKAFSILVKSLILVAFLLACMLLTEQTSLLNKSRTIFDLLFEVLSAFGTVGLSLSVTPTLSVMGKIIIILTMFIGRTGVFAMALSFGRDQKERFFEYPSASIMVG